MKVILFGSNGMLGGYIKSYFLYNNVNTIALTRNDIDIAIANHHVLEHFLKKYDIDESTVVINAAGIIPQVSAQKLIHDYDYIKVNSIFPSILSTIVEKFNAKMIHITTDCVFSGNNDDNQTIISRNINGKYVETDIHDAQDMYGISKSMGENIHCTVIRTSIIGEELYNKRSLLEWVKKNNNGSINGYKNHMWNGVTCLQLAKIILHIIQNNLYWIGVRHIFSPSIVSKHELVTYINDIYDLNIDIKDYYCDKSVDKSMSTIYNDFKYDIPLIRDQISELQNFKLCN